jgi:hypothetical protein
LWLHRLYGLLRLYCLLGLCDRSLWRGERGLLGRNLRLLRLRCCLTCERCFCRFACFGSGIAKGASRREWCGWISCLSLNPRVLNPRFLGGGCLSGGCLNSGCLNSLFRCLLTARSGGNVLGPSFAAPPAKLTRVVWIRVPARRHCAAAASGRSL